MQLSELFIAMLQTAPFFHKPMQRVYSSPFFDNTCGHRFHILMATLLVVMFCVLLHPEFCPHASLQQLRTF